MFRVGGIYPDSHRRFWKVVSISPSELIVFRVFHDGRLGRTQWPHKPDGTWCGANKGHDLLPTEYVWEAMLTSDGLTHASGFRRLTSVPSGLASTMLAASMRTNRDINPKPLPTPAPKRFDPWKGWHPTVEVGGLEYDPETEDASQQRHPLQQDGDYNNPKHGSSGFFYKEMK